jgi:hypothetical protein
VDARLLVANMQDGVANYRRQLLHNTAVLYSVPWRFRMAKEKFHVLLMARIILPFSGIPSFVQQQTSTEKKQLDRYR